MVYNIYKNISDADFKILNDQIREIDKRMRGLCANYNFFQTERSRVGDGLELFYSRRDGKFIGSIGLFFEDKPNKLCFTFSIGKSFDSKNRRYFKEAILMKEVSLEEIKK